MKALLLIGLSMFSVPAFAEDALALLKKYDAIMAPPVAKMEATMTVTRDDGSQRTYRMRILKKGDDKSRVSFDKPASMAGQEILRVGDNAWIYLPDIKRATNMSNRESFQGGDFSNADMLRPNLSQDYEPKVIESGDPEAVALELTSKTKETAYQTIKLWLRKKDTLPLKAQYFATSGKLLRSTRFSDYKEFQPGHVRPAKVLMTNETVKNRHSELELLKLDTKVELPDGRFVLNDLGK
jgi:outer membrane lipoprotein-sorting protein